MKKILTLIFTFILISYGCSQKKSQIPSSLANTTVDALTFSKMLVNDANSLLLDVRTDDEFKSGSIEGAINIDFNGADFLKEVEKLDKSKTIFLFCKSGGRSNAAMEEMTENGFVKIINLENGIMGWKSNSLPITTNPLAKKNDKNFDLKNEISSNKLLLVDFFAKWCQPCQRMKPSLEKLETINKDKLKILRLDVDEYNSLSNSLNIEALPTLILYRDGIEVKRVSNEMSYEEMEKFIN